MTTLFITTEIILAIIIILLTLMNKSSSIGFGAYKEENMGIGFNSFLSNATLGFIIAFIFNTLSLSYFISQISTSSLV